MKPFHRLLPNIRSVLFLLLSFWLLPASAEGFFQFHSENIQLLHGTHYELGDSDRSIVTFEHVDGHRWGDFFLFVDWTYPEHRDSTYYGEISPRFSYNKLFRKPDGTGLIRDVLISLNFEKPKNMKIRELYGLAVDLNFPGFLFFKLNGYLRDDPDLKGDTWQATLVWNAPFTIGGASLLAEGFADLAGGEGPTKVHNELIVPRLLLDIGELAGIEAKRLYFGVEYSYWHNKYGIRGVTESAPQIQLKLML